MSQQVLCALIALITYTAAVLIAQVENLGQRHAILHNRYGCVAYVHREKYHRLCQIDEIPIDVLFNFALSGLSQGKAITVDSDGNFRITLFSGFPVPNNPSNPRYFDVPDFKQEYVWEAGASQEDDNKGIWVMADTFCLARKLNDKSFQQIGFCPQPAYTGPLLPNPYRMAVDGKDSVPLKYADSAAGSGASASAYDATLGDSSLDLFPTKGYPESVEKANTIADSGVKDFWKDPIDEDDNSMMDGIIFRRHPKNWVRNEEKAGSS